MRGTLIAAALLVVAPACNCGAPPGVTALYTDVAYTEDGRALLLEATDGLYAAAPPTATPGRLSEKHCQFSKTKSLDCVRLASDGRRAAALFTGNEKDPPGSAALHLFVLPRADGSQAASEEVLAQGVYDAAFSQDGAELVWAVSGGAPGTVSLMRLGPAGPELLVPAMSVAGAEASALKAAVLTPTGLAHGRSRDGYIEIWFKPFDGEYLQVGRLSTGCGGTSFSRCVAASPDGSTLAWQDDDGAVMHVFRTQRQFDLPLGQGYGMSLSRSGTLALRMDVGPDSANIQNVDTAVRVRYVGGAVSGELSPDGEQLAYLTVESATLQTNRLFVGPTRFGDRDHDYGVFGIPLYRPLLPGSVGNGALDHSFTGDGRFVVVSAKSPASGVADLVAVNVQTAEQQLLGRYSCNHCCGVAPSGALVVCLPTVSNGTASAPVPVEIYDPGTGTKTAAASKAIDLDYLYDGSGVAVLDYDGAIPEALLVTKDGRVASMGLALRFALSPVTPQIALIGANGGLSVQRLP